MALVVFLAVVFWVAPPIFALADRCDVAFERCTDIASDADDACSAQCSGRYGYDFYRLEICLERCESSYDREWSTCEAHYERCDRTALAPSGQSESSRSALYGSQDSGQDGCYFGECPDDLKRQPDDQGQQRQTPPPRQQEPRQQQQWPYPQQTQSFDSTSICQTPAFWCRMFSRGPVGVPCWCNSFWGRVNGVTVTEH